MRHGTWALRIAALAGLATAVAALPVWAQDEDDEEEISWYANSGPYLVGAVIYGFPTEEGEIEDLVEDEVGAPSSARDVQGSFGFDARLGYRIDPRGAIEGQFEWLRSFDARADTPGGTVDAEARFISATGNGKVFLLTDRVQPYLLAGVGYGWSRLHLPGNDDRDDGFVARAGAGVDVYGTRMVALNLEASYLLATGGVEEFDHVSIGAGLTLRFYAED